MEFCTVINKVLLFGDPAFNEPILTMKRKTSGEPTDDGLCSTLLQGKRH
jgi:hypothetical protein